MINIKDYIKNIIKEDIDENLFWKLDIWFSKFPEQKHKLRNALSKYNNVSFNKEDAEKIAKSINLDIYKFVNYIVDNRDEMQQLDYTYILYKIFDAIIINKNNDFIKG